MNGLADFYSRLHAPSPEPEPAGLRDVKVRSLIVGTEGRGFVLPTAAQHPELWAARETGEAEQANLRPPVPLPSPSPWA
jgi:hypothetical protein